jgi:AraC-like DNA-binding protein
MLHRIYDHYYNQTVYLAQNPLTRDQQDYDLFVPLLGCLHGKKGFKYRSVQEYVVVHAIQAGSARYIVDGKSYIKASGDLFFTFPGNRVSCRDNSTEHLLEYMWIHLGGAKARWALEQCGVSTANPLLKSGFTSEMKGLWGELLQHLVARRVDTVYSINWAWRFIRSLMRITGVATGSFKDPGTPEKALDYILHSPMAITLSVNELAARLNMDRSTLFRFFKKQYGVSPKIYLDTVKLEKSADLLKNTRMRAAEIAYECGFSDPCYFNRVFRKTYGMSPGKWRRQNIKTEPEDR